MPVGIDRVQPLLPAGPSPWLCVEKEGLLKPTPPRNPGQWIAEECRELGVTLHHVAVEARIAPSTVYRWSTGSSSPWDALGRVCAVLERIREERSAKHAAQDDAFFQSADERKEAG